MAVVILILGVSWVTISALGNMATATADKEIRTGQALSAAKQALLGYAAQYAARTDHDVPGRLPCPEPLSPPAGSEGTAASLTCNPNNQTYVGRLPWRTLGTGQLRDGEGEPLWYVLGPGFRASPINPGTPGGLTLDGVANSAVAVIIAPGVALNNLSDPGTPTAGCAKVNQMVNRYATPFDPAKFFECGNAAGSYANPGTSNWSNDRVISITAAELMDAIAGPVTDRLQRTVAPALQDWRQTESVASWGVSFLPYASAFSNPVTNDYCGDNGVWEGLPPIAASSTGCGRWSSGIVAPLLGTPLAPSCAPTGPNLLCTFWGSNLSLFPVLFSVRITAPAPGVASSFRAPITSATITVSPAVAISNFSLVLSPATGNATLVFDVSKTLPAFSFTAFTVTIPNLPDAAVLSDARITWFRNNNWQQYTYYAAAPGATVNPPAPCAAPGDAGCLTANGLPASSGNANDKRLVLALMGRRLAAQPAVCNAAGNCLEGENASTGDRVFATAPPGPTFNDRLAACPFQITPVAGPVAICN